MKKTILIAGGTDGIGLSLLKRCSQSKKYRNLYVLGRNFSNVNALHDECIVSLPCDITDIRSIQQVVDLISKPLDEFVNTIGTFQKKPVKELKIEDIQQHFWLNSIANISLTTSVFPKLKKSFSQILVCLASLALEAREEYSLQSATKASYRFFLESMRKEVGRHSRIMMIYPPSVQTKIFEKFGDNRSLVNYPKPEVIADIMYFMLTQPKMIDIPDLLVKNRIL